MPGQTQTSTQRAPNGARWRVVPAALPCRFPFVGLYLEALGQVFEGREQESSMDLECDRVVEPVDGWERFEHEGWGEHNQLIEDWFDAGDEIQHLDTRVHELDIDEPDRWERALHWVRSLLVAT